MPLCESSLKRSVLDCGSKFTDYGSLCHLRLIFMRKIPFDEFT